MRLKVTPSSDNENYRLLIGNVVEIIEHDDVLALSNRILDTHNMCMHCFQYYNEINVLADEAPFSVKTSSNGFEVTVDSNDLVTVCYKVATVKLDIASALDFAERLQALCEKVCYVKEPQE